MATDYVAPGPRKPSPGAYDGLCKYLVEQQQFRVLWRAMGITFAFFSLATFSWVSWGELVYRLFISAASSIAAFLLGVAPLVLYLTNGYKRRKQPYRDLSSRIWPILTQGSSWRIFALYQVSAVSFAVCFVWASHPSTRISFFKPTKLYPWHLNERAVFLITCNWLLGLVYTFTGLVKQRWTAQWILARDKPYGMLVMNRLQAQSQTMGKLGLISASLGIALYFTTRRWLYWYGLWFFKPFIYNFVYSRLWGISFNVFLRLALLQACTIGAWVTTETMLSVRMGMPVDIAKHAPKSIDCLLSGITSRDADGFYQQYAIHELAVLAQDPKAAPRRKAIFSDLRNPSSASAWSVICRELLLVLGQDYQTLINRGVPPPPTQPPAVESLPPKPSLNSVHRTPTALKKAQMITPSRTTSEKTLDTLGYSVTVADAVATGVPKLARSLSEKLSRTPGKAEPLSVDAIVKSSTNKLQGFVPSMSQWGIETFDPVQKEMDLVVPNLARDVWAVMALAYFTGASLQEDPYGLVQRDIPKILEALVLLKGAVEDFSRTVPPDAPVTLLSHALADGTSHILLTFRDRMTAFRFPLHIGNILQKMLD